MVDKLDREQLAASRTCVHCGTPQPLDYYYRGRARCKDCSKAEMRDYYNRTKPPLKPKPVPQGRDRARAKASAYRRRYGIGIDQRDAMLAAQGDVCAICGGDDPVGYDWCTDHDHACCPKRGHSCGSCIRGILCRKCNLALGHFDDDIDRLRSAIDYLTAWEARNG